MTDLFSLKCTFASLACPGMHPVQAQKLSKHIQQNAEQHIQKVDQHNSRKFSAKENIHKEKLD